MEKILIIGCKKIMNDVCIACSRCTVAFNRKDGEFARYKDDDAQLLGILNCGDCPGSATAIRLALFKLWNAPMGELPTKIHLGNCLADNCPYRDTLLPMIKQKAGVEVVVGTHPYKAADLFKPNEALPLKGKSFSRQKLAFQALCSISESDIALAKASELGYTSQSNLP
jgi:predicted metal-binding protein